ncbi:hypothetical protein DAPPUDRAFT_245971 [Daphnia pulex]|uniref:Uncharacterized protein n=1 Tax=Daphnia pulex TaxID=6669 RepID=E9GPE2_DAPPU|nr:hypothetical protein DAPPUDRAFT_245971 [Daphnia pulex]|eukprot:EFX78694.1 hypothetical protein DAPPUDRAFT_245971 [Daphnia pulex]
MGPEGFSKIGAGKDTLPALPVIFQIGAGMIPQLKQEHALPTLMQPLILDRPTMPIILPSNISKKSKASKSFWRKELAESNISYQELQKNYEQAMNNVKDILTLFDDNRIMVKNSKKSRAVGYG